MTLSAALVALAALFWGITGGVGGMLMAEGWDAYVVSFYRGAIGLVFVLAWLMLRPQRSGLNYYQLWLWSIVAGLGIAGNFGFYFVSIEQGSVSVAVTLMYSAPVFVYLISFALKLEQPTPLKWLAIGVVMVGIVLLTQLYNIGASGITLMGVSAGLLAGISYTVFIFGLKYAAPYGSPQSILAIAFTVLAITLLIPANTGQTLAVLSAPVWPYFLVIGVLGAGISFVIYILGLNFTAPAVAAMVAMVEPVAATLFGVMVLSESLALTQLLGMALILVTVTAMSVDFRRHESTPDYYYYQ